MDAHQKGMSIFGDGDTPSFPISLMVSGVRYQVSGLKHSFLNGLNYFKSL